MSVRSVNRTGDPDDDDGFSFRHSDGSISNWSAATRPAVGPGGLSVPSPKANFYHLTESRVRAIWATAHPPTRRAP